jgi:hypothetical protein
MIEYSPGYIEQAKIQLADLEAKMSPKEIAISRELAELFKECSTKMRVCGERP